MQEQNYYQTNSQYAFSNINFYPPADPKQTEKKEIRKTAVTIGISNLLMIFVSLFWVTAMGFVLGFFGISYEKISTLFADPFINEIVQILFSLILFTIPFFWVFKISGYSVTKTVAFSKPKKEKILPLILIGVGFCSFANIAVGIAGTIFSSFGINYNVDSGENPEGILGFVISFISTAIVPALVEEFACRGLILGAVRKFGDGFAIIVSSVVFGLMHGNFEQIPFAFLVGVILAFITIKSGGIWLPIVVHGINNAISVFMDYLFLGVSDRVQSLVYCVYLAVALISAILGAYLYSKKDEKAFTFTNVDMKSSEKEKLKFFFTSPLMVIFIIACLIEALLYF